MQKTFRVTLTEQQVRTIAWAVNADVTDAIINTMVVDIVSEIEIPNDLLRKRPQDPHHFVPTGTRIDSKCAVCLQVGTHYSHDLMREMHQPNQ